jgi:polysaccharide deacetylase family protein (PEP-CTERM system associated)
MLDQLKRDGVDAARSPPVTASYPSQSLAERPINALTVDVEDYFQVEAFKNIIDTAEWDRWPARVERNTDQILSLMDEAGVHGTFFILGWVARRYPSIVRKIAARGHEVASHGSSHERADRQDPQTFHSDVLDAKAELEDISGELVQGYRAPTFSIHRGNWWAYDKLAMAGYSYSSSIYPIRHDLYGMPDAPRTPFRPTDAALLEIPMTTIRLFNRNFPCSGGGYFRLLPYAYSRWALERVNRRENSAGIFYTHPWEFDEGQPRMHAAGIKSRMRHYTNIKKMPARFSRLLHEFRWDRMDRVFLSSNNSKGILRQG